MNLKDDKLNIVITPNSNKLRLLDTFNNDNNLHNIKFMTKKEYLDNYYYSYDEKTILYLLKKYQLNIDIIKEYLKYMNVIDINKNYKSKKINYLKEIKIDLLNNNLLNENKYFKKYLEDKNIIVSNYYDLDKYEEDALNYEIKFDDIDYSHDIYEFNDLEDEIVFICTKIIDLLNKNIDINKIFLAGLSKDEYFIVKRIFSYFNIPINISNNSKIYSTKVVKEFIDNDKLDLKDEENIDLTKKLLSIKNSLVDIDDGSKEFKEILIDKIKNTNFTKTKLDNAVNLIDIYEREVNDDEYVFLLGFNMDTYPTIDKDIDYISDKEKEELPLYKTVFKNIRRKTTLINVLSKIKNITISYHLSTSFDTYYPSPLIDEYGFNVIADYKIKNNYSNFYNRLKLASYLDLYTTYNEEKEGLKELLTQYNIPYKMYSNKYNMISDFTKNYKLPLKLSYTSLNTYIECHFKYYLKNILKIDSYESTFASFIGSMFHDILTKVFDEDFDFEKEYNNYLKDKELTNKEKILLVRLKNELIKLIEIEKSQYQITNYHNSYYEKELSIELNKKVPVYFHGFIDRIFYTEKDNNFNYAILDYKTGTIDTDLLPMKYGLHLQLPSYLYLVNRSNNFNNLKFSGMYYQNILFDRPSYSKKDNNYEKIFIDKTKYVGYSTDDIERLEEFDSTYRKSDLIKSMSYTDKFNSNTKLLSDEQVDNMINYTEKIISKNIDKILDRDFSIDPKIYKKNNISCKYCTFKDICYKSNDDTIYLDTVEDLSFLGGDESEVD